MWSHTTPTVNYVYNGFNRGANILSFNLMNHLVVIARDALVQSVGIRYLTELRYNRKSGHYCTISTWSLCLKTLKVGSCGWGSPLNDLTVTRACEKTHTPIYLPLCPSRNLIFKLNDHLDMWKKSIFFRNCHLSIFSPYITSVKFCFQATSHGLSPTDVLFGFIWAFTIRK